MNNLSNIYRDEGLYGDALVRFPEKVQAFGCGKFSSYKKPDPGTLVVDKHYGIVKKIHYRVGNTHIYRTELIGEKWVCCVIPLEDFRRLKIKI